MWFTPDTVGSCIEGIYLSIFTSLYCASHCQYLFSVVVFAQFIIFQVTCFFRILIEDLAIVLDIMNSRFAIVLLCHLTFSQTFTIYLRI
jgi:hypothetical protein